MKKGLTLLCLLALCLWPMAGRAAFPDAPITMVVPFPPGGGSDRLARLVDAYTEKYLGKNMTFMYKPGGGTMIGTQFINTMPKDGYWIGTTNTPLIYGLILKNAPFTLESFDFIGQISSEPVVLVVPQGSPYKNLKDFIEGTKTRGSGMAVGIPSGTNGTSWFASESLQRKAGIKYTPVPLQGGNDLNAALLGKHVDAGMGVLGPILPESGKMQILAVSGEQRNALLPNVPTFKEQGVEILDIVRRCYLAPRGMPKDRLDTLRSSFQKLTSDKDFLALMEKSGFTVNWLDGEELLKEMRKELEEVKEFMK